ncbi:MAG: Outer rane efflux protein [Verrucomicrobiales bacterium]|nr:Outer rane efflux protein [Verrucomicrobiales bacterium]
MKTLGYHCTLPIVAAFFCLLGLASAEAAPEIPAAAGSPPITNTFAAIDLPTVLRLAGAQNLDVQIAIQRLKEASANRSSATALFLPSISPGITYHRRDGMAQAVPAGTVSETHLESYSPGGAIAAQVNIGDAIYQSLAAKQLVEASRQGLEAQRLDSCFAAAESYFDLVKSKALADVLAEAVNISNDYQKQLHQAVESGIAFKGDELRVQTQSQNYQIARRQALEQQQAASVTLAQLLHLDSTMELIPENGDMVPLKLIPPDAGVASLVQQALMARPELKQSRALVLAAGDAKKGAVYGPLIPSVGAQVFVGAFGGGHDNAPSNFGASQDYTLGISWKIGPGGLFDSGRVNASMARLTAAELTEAKLKESIIADVVRKHNRAQSLLEQITLTERKLTTAGETLRLTRERKQFGVGIVLEDIQAQQELTKARSDYLSAISEFNKAEFALSSALGKAR